MTRNRNGLARYLRKAFVALSLVVLAGVATAPAAFAQTPWPGPGIDGPWMDIFQVFWFTADSDYDHVDKGTTYGPNAAQRYDYGKYRHPQCYYHSPDGPDADWINALYDMMSCRIGLMSGALIWIGVGIAMMGLTWGGVMWVVDSNSGGDRAGALKNMVTGPLVGLVMLLLAYPVAKFVYSIVRYNMERYLDPDLWN